MRRKCISMLLAIVMALSLLPGTALAEEKEDIVYPVTGGNIYIHLIDDGKPQGYFVYKCDETVTKADIPGEINGHTINGIDEDAFSDCTNLTSVTIPAEIEYIMPGCFSGCSNLTEFVVDEDNASYSAENGILYSSWYADFKRVLAYPSATGECSISEGIIGIGNCAFQNCTGLTGLTIPSSVTSIGVYAFQNCTGLTSLTIPASVTDIEAPAFGGCVNLTNFSVAADNPNYSADGSILYNKDKTTLLACSSASGAFTVPNGVTSIGRDAFEDCTGLVSVVLPTTLTTIQWAAFQGCDNLSEVTIPVSVIKIGDFAFNVWGSLTDVYYAGSEEQWNAIDFSDYNNVLFNATIHYNSTGPDISTPDTPAANPVTVASASHGTVTTSPASAKAGETVTLTAKPEQGYELSALTVTDAGGKAVATSKQSDGTYAFTMPASAVTVQASFQEAKQSGTAFTFDFEFDTSSMAGHILTIKIIVYMNGIRLLDIPVELSLS